jgi:hypothetical protein
MPMNPNDPDYRREFLREADQEGVSTAAWAGIAVAAMIIGGVAMYAFSTHESSVTASKTQPNIEQGAPPATSGQGGVQSRMPATNDKAE